MANRAWTFMSAWGLAALILAGASCRGPTAATPATTPAAPTSEDTQMKIASTAFADGQPIPAKYSGEGQNASPPLSWSNPPPGAVSAGLIVDDPDAPRPQPWVHWVIYNLPPEGSLPEGVPGAARLDNPAGAIQGVNTGNKTGYQGPYPPKGHGVHHYHFKLYALDGRLDAKPGLTKDQLLKAMEGHILAQAELVGTYERR